MKLFQKHRKLVLLLPSLVLFAALTAFFTLSPAKNRQESSTQEHIATEESEIQPEAQPFISPKVDQGLTTLIEEWTDTKPGEYGIMVREITGSQRTASYRPDEQMISASTYKLFISYAALKHIEKGIFTLDTEVKPGVDISQCIEDLLTVSTDQCAWEMGNLIGWEKLNRFLYQESFTSTNLNNYDSEGNFTSEDKHSTARDEAEFAWRLATNTLLNKKHTDMMLGYMKKQIWRERIPAGVPDSVKVANKPGWIYRVQNDTAIVYGEKSTYVLAIMSDSSSTQNLAELSKIIYDYLHGND